MKLVQDELKICNRKVFPVLLELCSDLLAEDESRQHWFIAERCIFAACVCVISHCTLGELHWLKYAFA